MYPSIWVVFSLKCCESRKLSVVGSIISGIVGEAFTMGQMQVSVSAIRRSMSVGVVNLFL